MPGMAELAVPVPWHPPHPHVIAGQVEHLDPVIVGIRDIDKPGCRHRNALGLIELAGSGSVRSPPGYSGSSGGKFPDAVGYRIRGINAAGTVRCDRSRVYPNFWRYRPQRYGRCRYRSGEGKQENGGDKKKSMELQLVCHLNNHSRCI